MPWSKGAVVIVKRGDQEWADAMEQALAIKRASKEEIAEMERENTLLKTRMSKELEEKIADADRMYGYNFVWPKWLDPITGFFALIIYGIACFWDRFMTIKEWRE